jgi:hypothetical protein
VYIVSEFNLFTLPSDWVNPISQFIKTINFSSHDIPAGTKPFTDVEKMLKETLSTGKVKRI